MRGCKAKSAGILCGFRAFLTQQPPLPVEKDENFDFSESPYKNNRKSLRPCKQGEGFALSLYHLLLCTIIHAPHNGGMPAAPTVSSARSSGVIFGEVLLARGSHPPPLAWSFTPGLLSPSQLFSVSLLSVTLISYAAAKVKAIPHNSEWWSALKRPGQHGPGFFGFA